MFDYNDSSVKQRHTTGLWENATAGFSDSNPAQSGMEHSFRSDPSHSESPAAEEAGPENARAMNTADGLTPLGCGISSGPPIQCMKDRDAQKLYSAKMADLRPHVNFTNQPNSPDESRYQNQYDYMMSKSGLFNVELNERTDNAFKYMNWQNEQGKDPKEKNHSGFLDGIKNYFAKRKLKKWIKNKMINYEMNKKSDAYLSTNWYKTQYDADGYQYSLTH